MFADSNVGKFLFYYTKIKILLFSIFSETTNVVTIWALAKVETVINFMLQSLSKM